MKRRFVSAIGLSMALIALPACDKKEGVERSPTYPVRGMVLSIDGQPLGNVAVVAKKATATTDHQGRYQLKLPEGEAVLRFSKADHVDTIKKLTISREHPTMLHTKLLSANKAQKLSAEDGGLILGSSNKNGTVSAEFPTSAFVDAQGRKVSGEVSVRLTNIDASTEEVRQAAPGSFIGDNRGNMVQLESGGMLAIEVRDASGEKVQVAEGVKLKVKFPVAEGLSNPPDTMPLWSFDEVAGQWVWEGDTTLVQEGAELYYTSELPHMSTWNCDQPLLATCIMGCAKDEETGAPLAGAQVIVSGIDYVGNSQATTGADGCFRVAVRKSSAVRIMVQHKLGGGVSRPFDGAGEADTPVPPSSSTLCADAGEFVVERDTYNYDGVAVDCTSVMASLQGNACQEEFGEMMACMRVAGGCTYSLDTSSGMSLLEATMRWDSGARMVSSMGLHGNTMMGYDPEGQLCYSGNIDITNPNATLLSYTDAQGQKFRMEVKADLFTIECPSGKKFEITGEESEAMSACQAQQETDSCAMEGFDFCRGGCEQGEICCELSGMNYCMNEDSCTLSGGTPHS
ncbi:MAG: carboxypeptidase-like regulatory domain-containing protein [Cystobacterineae bacterium]|nr:carboxypeptidase-like regulatory domain-containing protein [Cystobacterineae bacterium]